MFQTTMIAMTERPPFEQPALQGLCKLLLSFGQKLNRRLHYSFGDKSNTELPHIAFPLLTSVDSLICTKDGEEVSQFNEERRGERVS